MKKQYPYKLNGEVSNKGFKKSPAFSGLGREKKTFPNTFWENLKALT
jgi:hypothetical protein